MSNSEQRTSGGTGKIVWKSANHPDFDPEPEGEADGAPTPQTVRVIYSIGHGLGDLIYRAAHPIGCWLDRVTKRLPKWMRTKFCGCSACSARRRWLNALVPDVRRWSGGWKVACRRLTGSLKGALKKLFRRRA